MMFKELEISIVSRGWSGLHSKFEFEQQSEQQSVKCDVRQTGNNIVDTGEAVRYCSLDAKLN